MRTLKEFTEWLEESSKPQFDLETFRSMTSHGSALRYLVKSSAKRLGSGTFRAAFKLESGKVIKIATLGEGIAQNKRELENSRCLGAEYSVQVLDHHPEFWWLIEEELSLPSEGEFAASFFTNLGVDQAAFPGFGDERIRDAITSAITGKLEGPAPAEVRKANQAWMRSKWYQTLVKRLRECQVSTFDLTANNWGIRPSTGQLVILDLGF
jgi:hypothetical protein